MINLNDIRVIAFDADDTLWDCQSHFEAVENHLYRLIAPYCEAPAKELFQTESGNMADLGYGCKAFTISIIETALRVGGDHLSAEELSDLLSHSKSLLHLPATPLPEVEETLQRLQAYPYRLVVFTKGELQDQENKLHRSGLAKYFSHVEITSNKTELEFQQLCEHLDILPSQLLMVGNSLKSDIAPALTIGASAIHIPFHVTWQLEHSEDIEHEKLVKITHFNEIISTLNSNPSSLTPNSQTHMKYIFETRMEVRDYECDIEGIVNNANYLHYAEHTRHLFLRSLGVSFAALHEQGIDAVVHSMKLQYKVPLRCDDEFISRLNLKKDGLKYLFYQDIYRASDEILCFRATVELVCLINGRLGNSPEYDEAFKDFI